MQKIPFNYQKEQLVFMLSNKKRYHLNVVRYLNK